MLNENHALSGALASLAVTDVGLLVGAVHWQPAAAGYVAVVTAGAATIPDLDQPGSAPSRAFGPATMTLAQALARLGRREQARTRTALDYRDEDGHRTVTHAWPAWVSMGAVIGAVCTLGGDWPVLITGFVFAAFALRSLLGPKGAARAVATVLRAAAKLVAVLAASTPRWRSRGLSAQVLNALAGLDAWVLRCCARLLRQMSRTARHWAWLCTAGCAAALAVLGSATATSAGLEALGPVLGAAVMLGMMCHCLGDCPSASGCPIAAPIKIRGRRWYRVRFTVAGRRGFQVGKTFERTRIAPALGAGTLLAAAALLPAASPEVAAYRIAIELAARTCLAAWS